MRATHRQTGRSNTPLTTSFHGIRKELVDMTWPIVAPLIERACERSGGKYIASDFFATTREGAQQLWVAAKDGVPTMALITEIRNYPQKRVAALVVCIGEGREDWLAHLETVEDWAKAQGCEAILAEARPGWERVLGWQKTHVILEKEL